MTAPAAVNRLVEVLPEWVAVIGYREVEARGQRMRVPRGNCIEASKLAVAVWRRLGIECKAMACDVDAANATGLLALAASGGRSIGAGWSVGVRCEPDAEANSLVIDRNPEGSFFGHLVVVGDDWFADVTAAQFHRPEIGIHVPGAVVGPYDPEDQGVQRLLDGGGMIRWYWRPEWKRWRVTRAWRQDVPRDLVDALIARMEKVEV